MVVRQSALLVSALLALGMVLGYGVSRFLQPPLRGLSPVGSSAALQVQESTDRNPVTLEALPPTMRDAFEILDQALSVHPKATDTDAEYLAKYLGSTDDELMIACFAAKRKLKAERGRISNEILANGPYETKILAPGEAVPGVSSGKETPVKSFVFRIDPREDGSSVYKFAIIEPGLYPEFHALELEWLWLDSYTKHKHIAD